MAQVTLYSRPDCHLCDVASSALQALRRRTPFELRRVNVEGDAALEARYGERLPVIAVDGAEVSAGPLDLVAVRQALATRG